MILPGVIASGGSGGGEYHAPAVHFDGNAFLGIASLMASVSTSIFSMSFWFNAAADNGLGNLFTVDPENNYTNNIICPRHNPSVGVFDNSELSLFPESGTNGYDISGTFSIVPGSWYNVLISASTNFSAGNKLGKCYVNDVDVTSLVDANAAFNMVFGGKSFYLCSDTFGQWGPGDLADVWVAPNVSLLTSGDILVADRRTFISALGKPVNPSGFPASAILFSGNASTFGTNQGTGGAFTLTGALTNASTSPSD